MNSRQVVEVFIVIDRSTLRRGILIAGLLALAVAFYVLSQARERAAPSAGSLIFSNQFMPGIEEAEEIAAVGRGAPAVSREERGDGKSGDLASVAALASAEPGSAIGAAFPQAQAPQPADLRPEAGRSAAFDLYRIARDQNRSREVEIIERMLQDDRLSGEERRELLQRLFELVRQRELEENAEGLLVARGYSDAIVVLGQSGAEVVVADPLEREEAARVGDVVARVAGVPLDAITIVDGAAMSGRAP